MVNYDKVRELVADASDAEKLQLLRSETKQILASIQGYGQLIYELVKERGIPEMPDDFLKWCEIIVTKTAELRDVIEAVADKQHRSIYQEENARRDRELGEILWQDAQAGLPELQPYSCLRDAVEQVAQQLGLSFTHEQMRIDDSFLHPGSSVHYFTPDRGARISAQRKPIGREYSGYSVAIRWVTDARNMQSGEEEGLVRSLEEAVLVLYRCLIEEWSQPQLIEKYPWLKSGRIE